MSEMMMNRILEMADEAYGAGGLCISEELENGMRDDGLADFLAVELREACQGNDEQDMPRIACYTIDCAIEQLVQVKNVLEEL